MQEFQPTDDEKRADAVCERFTNDWQSGRPVRIEDYLEPCHQSLRSMLLKKLVQREWRLRTRNGKRPSLEEYLARFPDDEDVIRGALDEATIEHNEITTQHKSFEVLPPGEEERSPETIGRYRVKRLLGQGGFGKVFLARDDQLKRLVAIKVPHPDRSLNAALYLAEAQTLASLDHPHIVPVHDVGSSPAFPWFIVSKYIEGSSLSDRIRSARFSCEQAARLTATLARALHFAHKRGVIHRDVKPGNILLDSNEVPYLVDFGLAMTDANAGSRPFYAGTPAYMSPEQARGEGHRVDGRSDIFSLGIVLYELLVGERPFGGGPQDVREEIVKAHVRPPRQRDDTIPEELERICLKALSRRAADRHNTAADLAQDLELFLNPGLDRLDFSPPTQRVQRRDTEPGERPSDSSSSQIKVVPKGLRSFDDADSEFFLQLLPGARDRYGLPESIRFWKSTVQTREFDPSLAVCVLYGPSGSGKSSFVKAGLIPQLDKDVIPVYVECTGSFTEARLLQTLRARCPGVPFDESLSGTMQAIRQGRSLLPGNKVLIILDQFEQWLHGRGDDAQTQLSDSLRQCNVQQLQTLLLVRDDFWMGITRFMHGLEIDLREGHNSQAVTRCDLRYAKKLLIAFGQAFGTLPARRRDFSADQDRFVESAVAQLASNDAVIPVRLALFADMMKGKPWQMASLREVGGMEGVGISFLEDTFSAATAPPEHRLHQDAAQAVLKSLLPEYGIDLRGHMRSRSELLESSGYAERPHDFDRVMRILDSETRLVTPADPEYAMTSGISDRGERYYQLTHDYLVQPLREWLERKQQASRHGRAEALLAERADLWNAKPEKQRLPSWWEYLNIRTYTRRQDWSDSQRKMMRVAARGFLTTAIIIASALALVGWLTYELRGIARADALLAGLPGADPERLLESPDGTGTPAAVQPFLQNRRWVGPRLLEQLDAYRSGRDGAIDAAELNASIVAHFMNGTHTDRLEDAALRGAPRLVDLIRRVIVNSQEFDVERFRNELVDEKVEPGRRLRAAGVLSGIPSEHPRLEHTSPAITEQLLDELYNDPGRFDRWVELFDPVRSILIRPLAQVFHDSDRRSGELLWSTDLLLAFGSDAPANLIAEWIAGANPEQFVKLMPLARSRSTELEKELEAIVAAYEYAEDREAAAKRAANSAVALVRLQRQTNIWRSLRHSSDPRLRSYVMAGLRELGADPALIARQLLRPQDTSVSRALILALADFDPSELASRQRDQVSRTLLSWYEHHEDAGIHAATELLCRRWGLEEKLIEVNRRLATGNVEGQRTWYLTQTEGHTLTVIQPIPFLRGSPPGPEKAGDWEDQVPCVIPRTYALSLKEVTVQQFLAFRPKHKYMHEFAITDDCPVQMVSWVDAAAYCNWLSAKEGIDEDQFCYLIHDGEVTLPKDYLSRVGYRLPTGMEWEYASRAGALTSRHFGETRDLLPRYEWYDNCRYPTPMPVSMPVGMLLPNDFGLFDTLGNVAEWCQERATSNEPRVLLARELPAVDREDLDSGEATVVTDERRQLRGGKFSDVEGFVRCAHRHRAAPNVPYHNVGFRIARTMSSDD